MVNYPDQYLSCECPCFELWCRNLNTLPNDRSVQKKGTKKTNTIYEIFPPPFIRTVVSEPLITEEGPGDTERSRSSVTLSVGRWVRYKILRLRYLSSRHLIPFDLKRTDKVLWGKPHIFYIRRSSSKTLFYYFTVKRIY